VIGSSVRIKFASLKFLSLLAQAFDPFDKLIAWFFLLSVALSSLWLYAFEVLWKNARVA